MSKRFTLHASSFTILFGSLLFAGLAASPALAVNQADCNKQGACATAAECSDTAKFENLTALDCPDGYVCCRPKTSSQPGSSAPAPAPTGATKSTKLGNPLC